MSLIEIICFFGLISLPYVDLHTFFSPVFLWKAIMLQLSYIGLWSWWSLNLKLLRPERSTEKKRSLISSSHIKANYFNNCQILTLQCRWVESRKRKSKKLMIALHVSSWQYPIVIFPELNFLSLSHDGHLCPPVPMRH